jgi:hypothetical protein
MDGDAIAAALLGPLAAWSCDHGPVSTLCRLLVATYGEGEGRAGGGLGPWSCSNVSARGRRRPPLTVLPKAAGSQVFVSAARDPRRLSPSGLQGMVRSRTIGAPAARVGRERFEAAPTGVARHRTTAVPEASAPGSGDPHWLAGFWPRRPERSGIEPCPLSAPGPGGGALWRPQPAGSGRADPFGRPARSSRYASSSPYASARGDDGLPGARRVESSAAIGRR